MAKQKEIELDENFKEFIALLNLHKVKYLLVGGFAVGLHGYPRHTGDLDIWVRPDLSNGTKILKVLKKFGFGSLGLTAESFIKEDIVHQFGYPPLRIDILTGVSGITFDECYARKQKMLLGGITVNVVHLNDLIHNKLSSGRPEDLYDVKKLEQVESNGKKTGKRKK
jgi:predicted nucleotidyltransferase